MPFSAQIYRSALTAKKLPLLIEKNPVIAVEASSLFADSFIDILLIEQALLQLQHSPAFSEYACPFLADSPR